MPYLRNVIIFLVPLIGFAAFQVGTAPLRYELWKTSSDAINAFLSPGTDPVDWNGIRGLKLRLAIYTWSVFVLIGVVTGILIPERSSGERAANAITAMSVGIGVANILFGVNHMSWLQIAPFLGGAVICAICVVWIKWRTEARQERLRVQ